MKLVFFSFRYRHRYKDLNNFLNSRNYGKYFVLNLGGPFKYFIAKILIFLKIGKAISCDGRPVINDKSIGINFWVRGTILNIPKTFRNLNNNFVTVYHSLLQNNKIFQIYPINIKKANVQSDLKIIYMSTINIETNDEEKNIWKKYKFQIIKDFSLIDKKEFWDTVVPNSNNDDKRLSLYRKLKLLLRFEIIKNLKEKFNNKLDLTGNNWSFYSFNSLPSNYNIKQNKKKI